jgi:hypothetical protein
MMFFGTGMFLAAGATLGIALVDKVCEDLGIFWLNTVLRLILPIVGFGLCVYFLETNALLHWIVL